MVRRPQDQPRRVDLLRKVEDDLETLRRSGALDVALRRWQKHRKEFRSFGDADALIAFLRDPEVEPRRAKDSALTAICAECARGDQAAAALLLWLMIPGLLLVRRRLVTDALDQEDLDAELLAGMWEVAMSIELITPNVATRLRHGARRRALAAVRQAEDWAGRMDPLTTEAAESSGPEAGASDIVDVLSEAVRAGVISAAQAELFRASRSNIRQLRSLMSVSDYGVRSRRLRAKRRLLAWLANRSPVPPQWYPHRSPQGIPNETPTSPATKRPGQRPL